MEKQRHWGRTIKCAVLILGVIIIPLVYSYFYLDAFWDPYSKLDTVPVAVVNEDKGARINGEFQNLGDRMVNTLKDEKSLKWYFTDAKEAADGLKTGKKYYAVITIPSDFSAKIATAKTTDKQPATIEYSSNEKRSYLATQILHSATIQLEEKVRSQVAEELTGQLTDQLNDVPNQLNTLNDGMVQLSDGSAQLNTGLDKLYSGSKELAAHLNLLKNGLNQAHKGTSQLNGATAQLPTLTNGVAKLNSGAGSLYAGMKKADSGAAELNQGAAELGKLTAGVSSLGGGATKLDAGAQQLSEGAASLLTGTSELEQGTQQYVAVVNLISSTLQANQYQVTNSVISLGKQYAAKAAAAQLPDATAEQKAEATLFQNAMAILGGNTTTTNQLSAMSASLQAADPATAGQLAYMANQLKQPEAMAASAKFAQSGANLVAGAADAKKGAGSLSGGAADLRKGTSDLQAGTEQLAAGTKKLAALQSSIAQMKNALDELTEGGQQVADGTGTLATGTAKLAELQSAVNKLDTALAQLSSGSGKIYSGSQTLENGISDAKEGSGKLNDGLNTAKSSLTEKIDQTKSDLKVTQGLDQYAGESVSLKSNPYDAVPNYGTAFAPYFLSLSMWVGALMMLFGIYLDPGKRIKKLAKGTDTRLLRIAAFYAIGIAQSVLLAFVVQNCLGLQVNYPVPYYFSILLGSMTFITIVQFFVVNIGDIGKFLAIVFLILQLTSCGGTFPMETVPQIFKALYRFMPMTYTVELLREVISGVDMGYAWNNALVLICTLLAFAAAAAIFAALKKNLSKRKDIGSSTGIPV